ncbi:MAG TPA: S9 family peptidase [Chitinophagaceae bacterium]|nr:S9 family peptidase [Chitinophagaceae bacterium]
MTTNIKSLGALSLLWLGAMHSFAQTNLTPEKLWSLGRVAAQGVNKTSGIVYYSVSVPDMNENKSKTTFYEVSAKGGSPRSIAKVPGEPDIKVPENAENVKVSPDQKHVIYSRDVKLQQISGKDRYNNLSKSNVLVYDNLNQRHWDTWEDGSYSHVFIADLIGDAAVNEKDIMQGELFDCPQKPHGGAEDLMFSSDGKYVVYVTKKLNGRAYAESTNSDIYAYDIESGKTENLTEGMKGYDTNPVFSRDGNSMAWLSMKTADCESDKNEIWVMNWNSHDKMNLTANWDETASGIVWSNDGEKIYYTAPWHGTEQLFEVSLRNQEVRQITQGKFDVNGAVDQIGTSMIVSRTDMNHAAELYTVDLQSGAMTQITHVNDAAYAAINMCEVKERYTELGNGEKVFSWVIYPPNFDASKKYPMLLYCQGGPQSALSQFYSFRWNFQLMASQGYIIIAPNRTGMPGWGTEWNAAISKDWGGNPMRDYLAVVDDLSEEEYIDKDRRGAVGASYGGYSVFMLAGIHEGRFKTFISHCGLFDLRSWYGTTEELWFANWDIGGPYWEKENREAQHSYKNFSPSNYVDNWNTPILIFQGGKDYRVPIEQGLQAFQAAQIKGLKSRFVLLPDENHWVMKPQNGMVWQSEFYKWLAETL